MTHTHLLRIAAVGAAASFLFALCAEPVAARGGRGGGGRSGGFSRGGGRSSGGGGFSRGGSYRSSGGSSYRSSGGSRYRSSGGSSYRSSGGSSYRSSGGSSYRSSGGSNYRSSGGSSSIRSRIRNSSGGSNFRRSLGNSGGSSYRSGGSRSGQSSRYNPFSGSSRNGIRSSGGNRGRQIVGSSLNRGSGFRSGGINRGRRSDPFRSRWNDWGGRRSGYRSGLRRSWGFWLTRGYAGWGLNFGFYSPGYYFDYAYAAPYNNYYNPYCDPVGFFPVEQPAYNYAQPLNGQYAPSDDGVQFMAAADDAFRSGDYQTALANVDKAAQAMPNNPDVHHFRSLVFFAMKNYREAAAAAHAALTAGRGWNWEVLRSFYPSKDAYTVQLRALEAFRRENINDSAARFLLGYHYMMLGHGDHAAREFVAVMQLEPRDTLSAELIKSISEKTGKQYAVPERGINGVPPAVKKPKEGGTGPKLPPLPPLPKQKKGIDGKAPAPPKLSGNWKATGANGTVIALSLLDGNKFRWSATKDGRTTSLEGTYSLQGEQLRLRAAKTGQVLEGKLTRTEDRKFHLQPKWLGAGDKGLDFQRQ